MRLEASIAAYLRQLVILGRAQTTIRATDYALRALVRFLEGLGIVAVDGLNREAILLYQEELAFRPASKGAPLTLPSQATLLVIVQGFCRYLHHEGYLASDPGAGLCLPKKPKRLPKVILEEAEVRLLLDAPDRQSNRGCRNRVILALLYDTGIMAAEMAAVQTRQLDLDGDYLHVVAGKGAKDRVVPVSSQVCRLIREYLLMVRPQMVAAEDDGHLVLNRFGRKMTPLAIWSVVKRCARLAGLEKNISTHTFRHSCATHMLRNGAPIRHIQELLGHESLDSTQIYTKVTINDLKAIHAKYHPGA